jgi:hypothetical protein
LEGRSFVAVALSDAASVFVVVAEAGDLDAWDAYPVFAVVLGDGALDEVLERVVFRFAFEQVMESSDVWQGAGEVWSFVGHPADERAVP